MKHVVVALVFGISLLPLHVQSEAEVGSVAQVKGKEVILKYSNAENPLKIDQLIHIVSSEGKAVVLKVTYPMQTSARCTVVSGNVSVVKSGAKVFDGDKVVEKKKDKPAEETVRAGTDPYKVNPSNGHRYFITNWATWEEAEKEAVAAGGHLVTLNDSNEEDWVKATFGKREGFWIGLICLHWYGFEWISGEKPVYTNWDTNQPSGGTGKAVYMNFWHAGAIGGGWCDVLMNARFRGIAEIDK